MMSQNEHIVKEINRLQDNVRNKLRDIKHSTIHSRRAFEIQYEPLIEPLKQLAQNNNTISGVKQDPSFESSDVAPISTTSKPAHFQTYSVGDLLDTYIKFIQTDIKGEADRTYGIYYDDDTWKMGSYAVQFSDNNIIIDGITYKGTPGLFELIFKKNPNEYTESDLENYKSMLLHTGAHRIGDGTRVKGNKGPKYTNIIANIFPSKKRKHQLTFTYDVKKPVITQQTSHLSELNGSIPETSLQEHKKMRPTSGEGLEMRLANTKFDYRYWDDPNEMVDRLRLLNASKQAGNTSLNNEIISILEELKEANIIKDYSNFKL